MKWLTQKETLIGEVSRYITQVSAITPPPIEYIANLQQIRVFIQTANEAELSEYLKWWETVKPQEAQA